jgi:hypothetical protein
MSETPDTDGAIARLHRALRQDPPPGKVRLSAPDGWALLIEIERLREMRHLLRLAERTEQRRSEDERAG